MNPALDKPPLEDELGDVLESRAGIERTQLRPLLEECRNTGANFGECLLAKGLVERDVIMQVTSRLIVNRAALKTDPRVAALVEGFRAAVSEAKAA